MRLLEYLRPGLRENPEIQEIQAAFQRQVDRLWADIDASIAQLNIETTTWGLPLWERALGIPVEAERPVEFRRSRAKAKIRGQGTTTAEVIQNVASSFSGGKVEVEEHPEEYRVDIRFVDAIGLPPNLDDLKAAIAEIIPAHLEARYISTLKTWNDVNHFTWNEVAGQTWEELRGGTL